MSAYTLSGILEAIKTLVTATGGKVDTLHDTRLTSARAGYLDAINTNLDATVSSRLASNDSRLDLLGLDAPPIAAGLVGREVANAQIYQVNGGQRAWPAVSGSTSVYDSWTTILTLSGAGIMEFLPVYQTANASDRDAQLRLTIDGVVVYTSDVDLWKATGDNNDGVCLVGDIFVSGGSVDFFTFGRLAFKSSFLLEFKKTENAAGTVTIAAQPVYTKTA